MGKGLMCVCTYILYMCIYIYIFIYVRVFKLLCQFIRVFFKFFLFSNSVANTSHIGRVCTTWGHYHFKTFDGDFFQLPSTCNHVLVSHCKASYESFAIQMRRSVVDNNPTISSIIMKLDGSVVELSNNSVIVNSET